MSSEVGWVLAQLQSVVDAQPADHPLRRVDRDDSELLEGNIRDRTGELKQANYVGASLADESTEPVGSQYDHRFERVVGLRIEGKRGSPSEFGHVDPDGAEGVVWEDLKHDIRHAILASRTFPDAGRTEVTYTDLQTANEAPQSDNWADYYRYDVDLVFRGYEELP